METLFGPLGGTDELRTGLSTCLVERVESAWFIRLNVSANPLTLEGADDVDELLTIGEAAKILGVTTATLRNWDKEGKLQPKRDPENGYRLYRTIEVQALLLERQGGGSVNRSYQPTLLAPENVTRSGEVLDDRAFRRVVRQMSSAFRNSQGGGLLERFEEVTKLLYAKLFDEREYEEGRHPARRFRSDYGTEAEAYQAISKLYQSALNALPSPVPSKRRVLSGDVAAVMAVVRILETVDLRGLATDVKGHVFEELVARTFEKTENQQFFTPRVVVDFMVDLLDPGEGGRVLDPACGSGGFLTQVAERLRQSRPNMDSELVGLEIDERMAWVAQMNLVMHDEVTSRIHHLAGGGSLEITPEVADVVPLSSVDYIITNPPFGSDFTEAASLNKYELGRGRASRRRGVLFIERCIMWLRPGGKLAIVIDDGVLNGSQNEDVRRLILRDCVLEAVISLPETTFMPYASVKTSILLLRRRQDITEEQGDVLMAKAEYVGRKPNGDPLYNDDLGPDGRLTLKNDLPGILERLVEAKNRGVTPAQEGESAVFVCQANRFSVSSNPEYRLDVQFHHPSRSIAEVALRRSIFPTPKLAELVVERNDSIVPSLADPDDTWSYVGLANIEAETGQYGIVPMPGRQLKSAVKAFRGGDIIFSKLRPELRKCALIRQEDEGYVSAECFVFRVIDASTTTSVVHQVDSEYLSLMLRSDVVFGQLVNQVTGTGRPRVNKSAVYSLRIPLPPIAVQRDIVRSHRESWANYLLARKRSEELLQEGRKRVAESAEYALSTLCPHD
jgi:tRNA1(Val) A37 N6-methylase TrmN6